jgi:hypothetical protein
VKLRLHPILESHFLDSLDFPRTRAETESVQGVQDGLLLVQLLDGEFAGEVPGRSINLTGIARLCRHHSCEYSGTQEDRGCDSGEAAHGSEGFRKLLEYSD